MRIRITQFLSRLLPKLKGLATVADLNDVHAYGGLIMVFYGLDKIYPPAAWILSGLILFWIGVRR